MKFLFEVVVFFIKLKYVEVGITYVRFDV